MKMLFGFDRTRWHALAAIAVALLVFLPASVVTADDLTYQVPPDAIRQIVDAPWTPSVYVSPDYKYMVLAGWPGLPSIEEVSRPEKRLAGLRINPANNGPSRGWHANSLVIQQMKNGKETEVTGLPESPQIKTMRFSPNSEWLAFTLTFPDHIELWTAEMKNGKAKKLCDRSLNAVYGTPYYWSPDSKSLIVKAIPDGRGDLPERSRVPAGPVIQENLGTKAAARTYQDLLKNPDDEAEFAYFATSEIVRVGLNGEVSVLGAPQLYTYAHPSPDGNYILAEYVHRPFSYTVPASRFPMKSEVWDESGSVVSVIGDLPLAEEIPIAFGSVRTGRRSIDWRADADATLSWAEALDGGDAGKDAEFRDAVYNLDAPFDRTPKEVAKIDVRYSSVNWSSDDLALVTGWWWKTRQVKTWRFKPGRDNTEQTLVMDYSWEDRYNDPGRPETVQNDRGFNVLLTKGNGKTIYLIGDGASPEGDRPFLDEFNVDTQKTRRLFRSEAPYYESVRIVLDAGKNKVLTRRESVTEPPNYFVRDLEKGELEQKTFFPHPTPQLADVQKEQIRYERADGVKLTGTLYLPPDYSADDGPLPCLMWAYPQEFKSADAAGQVTDSPYRFIRVSWYSPLVWLAHGYAVLDDPAMPIVGEGDEEPNDTYVEQLVASAQAAADEVVRRGVADPDKLCIAGHSYGAFMTANLLAHSDIYRAGIARSGAYNRTLTPFGFQAEERTFWEAPDVYFAMSPFMHADKVNEPLLLIHGEADNNSGTYPLQSERFYGALKGHGAIARLVMLPNESHGYRARESVLHVLWEMATWMDQYVKNAPPREDDMIKVKTDEG